jgi:hypothetical protein
MNPLLYKLLGVVTLITAAGAIYLTMRHEIDTLKLENATLQAAVDDNNKAVEEFKKASEANLARHLPEIKKAIDTLAVESIRADALLHKKPTDYQITPNSGKSQTKPGISITAHTSDVLDAANLTLKINDHTAANNLFIEELTK